MMGKIHVLAKDVADKIAAGEVVERPSSVIKELVENSIDAHATLITVEIKKGGCTYMRVSDNGAGMSREDAEICFLRHATSKIESASDLEAIYTFGFRGEALSSIGAVSETTIYTKRAEDEDGICVSCRGGEILSSSDAGVPDGTSVTVENLFYNTPARLKFLKKDATEAGYITDIMTRFILAHPEISFRLIVDGKEKLFSAGDASLKNAVYTVYGRDYAKGTLEVDYEMGGIHVSGLVGKGTLARPKRNYQSTFVNTRYVRSASVTSALENAYKNQIMIGKFPMAVLNITVDPAYTDINVHPTKMEVKFSDEKAVYNAVYYAVKSALYEEASVPRIERTEREKSAQPQKEQLDLSDMVKELPRDIKERKAPPSYVPHITAPSIGDTKIQKKSEPHRDTKPKGDTKTDEGFDGLIFPRYSQLNSPDAEENVFADEYFEIVGQVFDTYIIAEKGNEMLIVDQHAAHERLKYEELKEEIASKPPAPQLLIEPVEVTLTAGEAEAYRENKEFFTAAGFEIEEARAQSLLVRGAPTGVEAGEVEPLIEELVSQAEHYKTELIAEKRERLLYTVACKSAVKANRKMSAEEMEALVRDVLRLKNINTCPHGRPIIVTMSKKEIEKEFKRIV